MSLSNTYALKDLPLSAVGKRVTIKLATASLPDTSISGYLIKAETTDPAVTQNMSGSIFRFAYEYNLTIQFGSRPEQVVYLESLDPQIPITVYEEYWSLGDEA